MSVKWITKRTPEETLIVHFQPFQPCYWHGAIVSYESSPCDQGDRIYISHLSRFGHEHDKELFNIDPLNGTDVLVKPAEPVMIDPGDTIRVTVTGDHNIRSSTVTVVGSEDKHFDRIHSCHHDICNLSYANKVSYMQSAGLGSELTRPELPFVDAECDSCHGTGVYIGSSEHDGAAVACITCKGTGRYKLKYKPFTTKQRRPGVKRVFFPGLTEVFINTPGGVTYEEWLADPSSLTAIGNEMRYDTCPRRIYMHQADKPELDNLPLWDRCQIGCPAGIRIDNCSFYHNKHLCWEEFDSFARPGHATVDIPSGSGVTTFGIIHFCLLCENYNIVRSEQPGQLVHRKREPQTLSDTCPQCFENRTDETLASAYVIENESDDRNALSYKVIQCPPDRLDNFSVFLRSFLMSKDGE